MLLEEIWLWCAGVTSDDSRGNKEEGMRFEGSET